MNEQFNEYLVIIAVIIAVIAAIPVLFLINARKRKIKMSYEPVDGGSASVFFDRAGNVVIIPYVKDRYGSGKATSNVEFLRLPFKAGKLGKLLRSSLAGCRNCEPCDTKQLLELLGTKDWNDFTDSRRNVSVFFKEGRGIVFSATRGVGKGAYEFIGRSHEKVLKPDASDEALGSALLEVVKQCR